MPGSVEDTDHLRKEVMVGPPYYVVILKKKKLERLELTFPAFLSFCHTYCISL
jgi:hypothetical protein